MKVCKISHRPERAMNDGRGHINRCIPAAQPVSPRQQVIVIERQGVDASFTTADIAPTSLDTPDDTLPQFSQSSSDENPVNHHQEEQAGRPAPSASGPSRARIQIKHIDLGLTPSEVVGTPDVLQRFDADGDRRVDLNEAARAGVAREGVFTFAGLSVGSGLVEPTARSPVPQATPSVPKSAVAFAAEPTDQNIFTPTELPGAAPTKKFFVAAKAAAAQVAAQGTPTGTVDAPKKFSGQGVEVVVGKFAVAETAPQFVEDTAKKVVVVTEEDSGETTAPDKVARTDTDQSQGPTQGKTQGESGDAAEQASIFEKAQWIDAAANGRGAKVVLVEVAAYASASDITAAAQAQAKVQATAVTV